MKYVLYAIIILVIISTISICIVQPDLHKNIIVYDSGYTLVTEQEVRTEAKETPVMEKTTQQTQTVKVVENVTPKKEVKDFKQTMATAQIETTPKKSVTTTKTQSTVSKKQTSTQQKQTTPVKTVQNVTKNTTPVEKKSEKFLNTTEVKVQEPPKTVSTQTPVKKIIQPSQPQILTQQEETIAWNKWRSNIQNQIMKDTKLPDMPNGVIFKFSFTVDKYGRITNVHTGADPAAYTPHAIQYIASVIRSYQGKSILNFPEGTARTSTEVTGKWRIADTTKYSTPQDFHDIETVRH